MAAPSPNAPTPADSPKLTPPPSKTGSPLGKTDEE